MRSLIRYLIKNYAFLLFLLLEVLSLAFVFNFNQYHKVQYLNSSNRFVGNVYGSFQLIVQYFELATVNKELAEENALLKSELQLVHSVIEVDSLNVSATLADSSFRYIPARVINNSVHRTQNYLTINKGRKHGIKPDQGIISPQGIVGVITGVSDNYSVGFSVLNNRWGPSAKLKRNGYFGPIEWEGTDYQTARLMEIPFHVDVQVGDTIVTSGYSAFFPEGVPIGIVSSFEQPQGESFYEIQIKLSVDYKSISYVYIVDHLRKYEIDELEKIRRDGETGN